MRPLFGKDYVRVLFGAREYTYYCPGAKIGDLIEVPPSDYYPDRQVRRVVATGRRYLGPVKKARLVLDEVNKK